MKLTTLKFIYFATVLILGISCVNSQLDFGDSEPIKDTRVVSEENEDGVANRLPDREDGQPSESPGGTKDDSARSTSKGKSRSALLPSFGRKPSSSPPRGVSVPVDPEAHGAIAGRHKIRHRPKVLGRVLGGYHHTPTPIVSEQVCHSRVDPGYCNLMIGRWYYDQRYHRCLPFLYTGCGGNQNNFLSFRVCERATKRCETMGDSLFDNHPLWKYLETPFNLMNPLSSLSPNFVMAG